MLFCSIEFIFLFLPAFLLIYWLVPDRFSNLVLFLGSLFFYAVGEPVYFVLILVSLAVHHLLIRFSEGKGQRVRTLCLCLMLAYGFGTLFIFKYLGFFEMNWNHLAQYLEARGGPVRLPVLDLPDISLPIGISFYTFQIASYAIDVWRRDIKPEKSIISLGAYLCMFPQLIAGPIVLYSDIAPQLARRRFRLSHVENGLKTFLIGLSLKVILANTCGILWNQVQTWGVSSVSVPMAWLGILAYTFQIYFDFQGYSMMAMGLGEILGFRIPRNFRHPYTAVTVTDFWHRWHITLSSWFRNYVYIPLGGSRKGTLRMLRNMFLVWAFTGLWHGASWNFVLWGLYYFLLLAFEKLILYPLGRRLFPEGTQKVPRLLRGAGWAYTFLAVMVGWVIFSTEDMGVIRDYLVRMFGYLTQKEAWMLGTDTLVQTLRQYGPYFLACAVCCTPAPFAVYKKYKKTAAAVILLLVLFGVCTWRLNSSASNPFLYFRF